ncbi:hypothetical protein FSP39_007725 [Pinctada imbricata]|uniref:Uncharacterized protein n=1 Tax=Pinctada imbricata TaxID=66713 RepID=A0AA88XVZ1_PINIB|nr:hypothetical protein FSP39_007725 [Pinctada imbricata]
MVTESFVYHWDLCQDWQFSEIISYKADPSLKWLALTGLTPEVTYVILYFYNAMEDRITGITQLYNVDEDITQCIGAHTVCFSEYHYADNPMPSTVMCAASRDALDHGKVHVIELGPYKQGNFAPRNNYDVLQYFDDVERFDFPVSLHVSREYGLLFLITKYGFLYLCDMETAACLCCTRISRSIVFASTLNTETQGVLGITRAGQDLKKYCVCIDTKHRNTGCVRNHQGWPGKSLCDMKTAACPCCTKISWSIVFATTQNTETQGVLGITRDGQISHCVIWRQQPVYVVLGSHRVLCLPQH